MKYNKTSIVMIAYSYLIGWQISHDVLDIYHNFNLFNQG